MNEKFVVIGQLIVGVVYEINNLVVVIFGNFDVLCDIFGLVVELVVLEIWLIYEQVYWVWLIVVKLLQFVCFQDYVGYFELVVLVLLVKDSLVLVGYLLKKGNIVIKQYFELMCYVLCNCNEL